MGCQQFVTISFYFIQLKEYKVIGRMVPTDKNRVPPLYQLRIFAPDPITARSRFWYFCAMLRKMKKTQGEVVLCQQVTLVFNRSSKCLPEQEISCEGLDIEEVKFLNPVFAMSMYRYLYWSGGRSPSYLEAFELIIVLSA